MSFRRRLPGDDSVNTFNDAAASERRSAFVRLGVVALAVLLGLVAVVCLAHAAPRPSWQRFDRGPLGKMRKLKPDFVLIGNSMVYTRFDTKTLNRTLRPKRALLITQPSSRSAMWYLMLKNYVVASGHRPRRVLIFFRDRELTLPREMKEAALRPLARVSRENEPLLDEMLEPPVSEIADHVGYHLGRWVPIHRLRPLGEAPANELGLEVARLVSGQERGVTQAAVNRVFGMGALRPVREAVGPPARQQKQPFGAVVEHSFLPEIVALAKRSKVPLAFVRVKTRQAALGFPEPPELASYQRDLRAYLDTQGVPLFDMTRTEWESARLYGQGDHIASRHLRTYTRLFVANVPAAFE